MVLFFFAERIDMHLSKILTEKPRNKEKYKRGPPGLPLRLREATRYAGMADRHSSKKPWTGRRPQAVGGSTLLGTRAPPSCTADDEAILDRHTRTFEIYTSRPRRPTATGAGKSHSRAPPSLEREEDSRSAAELHGSRTNGGGNHRHQKKPLRRRQTLHSAAS
jgi:hypothetical protein